MKFRQLKMRDLRALKTWTLRYSAETSATSAVKFQVA